MKITDELINERLEAKGFGEKQENDSELQRKAVLDYYEVELTDVFDSRDCDFYVYEEGTADGYDLFIATSDPNNIIFSEDVYYYDDELVDALVSAIEGPCHETKIYVNDLDANFVEGAIEELFFEVQDRMQDAVVDELLDEGYEE